LKDAALNFATPLSLQTIWNHRIGLGLIAATLAFGNPSLAQTIYVMVGKDGRITFADQAPVDANAKALANTSAAAAPVSSVPLPFELRQIISKYPVTLYSASKCEPCNAGRALLVKRGMVFAEKTINNAEDSQALRSLTGESALPFLMVGAQQIKGYSELEWTQFLDAAGYPKSSVLPSGYRNPPASPLALAQKPADTSSAPAVPNIGASAVAPPLPATASGSANPANPAGIQF